MKSASFNAGHTFGSGHYSIHFKQNANLGGGILKAYFAVQLLTGTLVCLCRRIEPLEEHASYYTMYEVYESSD